MQNDQSYYKRDTVLCIDSYSALVAHNYSMIFHFGMTDCYFLAAFAEVYNSFVLERLVYRTVDDTVGILKVCMVMAPLRIR